MTRYFTRNGWQIGMTVIGIALLCSVMTTAEVDKAAYLPKPHLTLSIIDPTHQSGEDAGTLIPVVLVHHSKAALFFHPQYGIGGDGVYPLEPYNGFSRSLDAFGDGSVVLVPVEDGGRRTTGMFVTLSSGNRHLFAERGAVRQLRPTGRIRVFGLRDHVDHDNVAHFREFES